MDKRLQRFVLMADDVGIQASLFLLLVLSDDEVRGYSSNKGIDGCDQKSSVSSSSTLSRRGASLISQSSKLKKKKIQVKNQMKELFSGFFKKTINSLLNNLELILGD